MSVQADVQNGCIVITITDEGEAYDIASAYGRRDRFYEDVMAAATAVWVKPFEQVSCPEHGTLCTGAGCCCSDLHRGAAPP